MKAKHIVLVAAALALAACGNEEIIENNESGSTGKVHMTFTAGMPQTRTSLGEDGHAVNWTQGDLVAIYDGTETICKFEATKVSGSTATLKGEAAETDTYTAFYPYTDDGTLTLTHDAITFTLPATQTATAGGFAEGLNPSWAQATDGSKNLTFQNLCALAKFTVDDSGLDGVTSLTLSANDTGDALAGSLTYTTADGTLAATGSASRSVTLKGTFEAGQTYYFVVAPGTLTGGITLSYTDSSNGLKYLKTTSKEVTLTAGHILNLDKVTFQPEAITDAAFIAAVEEGSIPRIGWTKEADGTVLLTDANKQAMAGVTTLNVFDKGLTSLPGIEYFTGLTTLECFNNSLTSLDVTGLTKLTDLLCYSNQLTELDLTGLTSLKTLNCFNNSLTSLDVTGLTKLTDLLCYSNQLTELDLTGLTSLKTLNCYNNDLTELDVNGLTNLITLLCYKNQLAELDVTTLSNLKMLHCGNQKNNITLDLYLTSAQQSKLNLSWYTQNGNINQCVQ